MAPPQAYNNQCKRVRQATTFSSPTTRKIKRQALPAHLSLTIHQRIGTWRGGALGEPQACVLAAPAWASCHFHSTSWRFSPGGPVKQTQGRTIQIKPITDGFPPQNKAHPISGPPGQLGPTCMHCQGQRIDVQNGKTGNGRSGANSSCGGKAHHAMFRCGPARTRATCTAPRLPFAYCCGNPSHSCNQPTRTVRRPQPTTRPRTLRI